MKDKEIEIKFEITASQKEKILADLKNVAVKVGDSHLVDTYYIPNFKSFMENGETIESVRIRESHKGSIINYKKIHKEATPVYCDEFETKVEDKDQMEKLLLAIGFEVEMVIDKTRETYIYKNFEIDFDFIKNLGLLMEVEIKDPNASIEDIYDFVGKYGLGVKDKRGGIQNLMRNKLGR